MDANSRTSLFSPCCPVVARVGAATGKPGQGTVFTHAIFGESSQLGAELQWERAKFFRPI